MLAEAARNGSTDLKFDVNNDGNVTFVYNPAGSAGDGTSDSDVWVRSLKGTEYGDANLLGDVTLGDLSALAQNWQDSPALWAEGNFNGDLETSLGDLSILAQNWQFGVASNAQVATTAVPEPDSAILLALGLAVMCLRFQSKP